MTTTTPTVSAELPEALTEDQWLDLAERHGMADWDSDEPDGFLNAIKAVCADYAAQVEALSAAQAGVPASLTGPMQFGGCPECGSRACVARECSRTVSHKAQAIPGIQWQCGPQANGFTAAPQPTPSPAPAQPGQEGELTRDQIRAIFMQHGFTVKEGQTDLKQYVYDAADALLSAARAAPQPATADAVLLDHLQRTGSTVELLPAAAFGDRWRFRVGGLHAAVNHDLRAAIAVAMEAHRATHQGDTK